MPEALSRSRDYGASSPLLQLQFAFPMLLNFLIYQPAVKLKMFNAEIARQKSSPEPRKAVVIKHRYNEGAQTRARSRIEQFVTRVKEQQSPRFLSGCYVSSNTNLHSFRELDPNLRS